MLTTETYASYLLLKRFCLPTDETLSERIKTAYSTLDLNGAIEELNEDKYAILLSIPIALIISYLFSFFLEKCTGVIVWGSILMFFVGYSLLCFLCWRQRGVYLARSEKTYETQEVRDSNARSAKYFTYIFYTMIIIEAIILLLLCCLIGRIQIAIGVIKVSIILIEGCW